jgi:uncharacterized membrane protein YfcA
VYTRDFDCAERIEGKAGTGLARKVTFEKQRLPVEYLFIAIIALCASILTFFSGFGLGTVLLAAFLYLFPDDPVTAVGLTAIVHLLNNIFKVTLVGRSMNLQVVLRFGLPAMLGSVAGSLLLLRLAELKPWVEYSLNGHVHFVTPIKVIIGLLMLTFAILELVPRFQKIQFGKQALVGGGILSGFFGGLSGHQGALRSMFLVKLGLDKAAFIATGIVIAVMVDIARLPSYLGDMAKADYEENLGLLVVAVAAAFAGAFAGSRLLRKVTIGFVQTVVALMIAVMALLMISGIV